jgi:hypothetical protein
MMQQTLERRTNVQLARIFAQIMNAYLRTDYLIVSFEQA